MADAPGPVDYIRAGEGACGIERAEVHFTRLAFSPHRHDTYAIGITLAGTQKFHYRGRKRYCRPYQCHILHPDETHDGAPATDAGFKYRIAYVDPSLIQQALAGRPLPFVSDPVVELTREQWARLRRLWEMGDDIDELGRVDLSVAVADTLESLAARPEGPRRLALQALSQVRDFLAVCPSRPLSASELERVAGLDRWNLARQFRAAFGTSPSRFRTMRQLDEVRRLLTRGSSCAEAALDAGFSDQSHMSRMFKRAYGLTPAAWARAVSGDSDAAPP
jgi:AraC-like DNA-binding protein